MPTSSRHVITDGLTKGNSIGVEIWTALVPKAVQIKPDTAALMMRNEVLTTSAWHFVSILRRFTWTIKLRRSDKISHF